MKISDEQYAKVGVACGWAEAYAVEQGKRAVAAVAPLLLAEPTEDEKRQMATDFAASANVEGTSGWDNFYHALRNMNANRLASMTAKPDPAVEAVKALPELNGWSEQARKSAAERIVAAVDAARAK